MCYPKCFLRMNSENGLGFSRGPHLFDFICLISENVDLICLHILNLIQIFQCSNVLVDKVNLTVAWVPSVRKIRKSWSISLYCFIYILDSSNSSSITFWTSQFSSSSRSNWTGIWTGNSNGSWTDKQSSHFSTAK